MTEVRQGRTVTQAAAYPATGAMRAAARGVIDSLPTHVRERALFPFETDDDGERVKWFYIPTDHGGLPITDIPIEDQRWVYQLLSAGLSASGYATAVLIMGQQPILDQLQRWLAPGSSDSVRESDLYYISIFGDPAEPIWGWRFGGHHISLNFTMCGDEISSTPIFFGLDPAATPLIGGYEFRPLASLEDFARELVTMLDPTQLAKAMISEVAPSDVVAGNRPRVVPGLRPIHFWEGGRKPWPEQARLEMVAMEDQAMESWGLREEHLAALELPPMPVGLPASEMNANQRQMLTKIIDQYLGRIPEDRGEPERERIAEVLPDLHFAWAGHRDAHHSHYYRVQGPSLLIEYDNFHRSGNHIHSVWRDPIGDFGRDLLARHGARDR